MPRQRIKTRNAPFPVSIRSVNSERHNQMAAFSGFEYGSSKDRPESHDSKETQEPSLYASARSNES